MANKKKKTVTQLGKQPPRYRFFLNPYEDVRSTKCPQCDNKMHQRKLPLVIHVDPMQILSLNKTCRYCPSVICSLHIKTTWNIFLPPTSPSRTQKSLATITWCLGHWTGQHG